MKLLSCCLWFVLCASLGGCKAGRPNWHQPGTVATQQYRATEYDPYGDNEAGPEIVGGRPREFQRPLSEPVRARAFRETRWPF